MDNEVKETIAQRNICNGKSSNVMSDAQDPIFHGGVNLAAGRPLRHNLTEADLEDEDSDNDHTWKPESDEDSDGEDDDDSKEITDGKGKN